MHRRLCSSEKWADFVAESMPGRLSGFDLGEKVLEIGPGYGATTKALLNHAPDLTALEIDEASAMRLRGEFDERVTVVHGDGAEMPFEDDMFSSVVCFTMMHHVPSRERQDAIFAEALRVLRPGGLLRGTDSLPNLRFRMLHIGDTMNVLPPATLPDRLGTAGFETVSVDHVPKQFIRFSGIKPG